MKTETIKVLNAYLNISGERYARDFNRLYDAAEAAQRHTSDLEHTLLEYVKRKAKKGLWLCASGGDQGIEVVVDEDTVEDIEAAIENGDLGKVQRPTTRRKKRDLGKLVDQGEEVPGSKADDYWGREGMDVVFSPDDHNVRIGAAFPKDYKFKDIRFLEKYYGLKAIEFGNWLSQQDRFNYLSGLGMSLYDLHKLLRFSPKQLGLKGKLSVAFGARGRGKAVASFLPKPFVINLTRYSRPPHLAKRSHNFKRAALILTQGGGVGAFAHEYAHALDTYCGTFIEETKENKYQISGGSHTDPHTPAKAAKKLQGLMNHLLAGIIWKNKNTHSDYYSRLLNYSEKDYFKQRSEIWARAFEVYVQYKLAKEKHTNIFLNEPKYDPDYYLTFAEIKKLEPEFDALLAAIKKHL